jgi:hypothetical protein
MRGQAWVVSFSLRQRVQQRAVIPREQWGRGRAREAQWLSQNRRVAQLEQAMSVTMPSPGYVKPSRSFFTLASDNSTKMTHFVFEPLLVPCARVLLRPGLSTIRSSIQDMACEKGTGLCLNNRRPTHRPIVRSVRLLCVNLCAYSAFDCHGT